MSQHNTPRLWLIGFGPREASGRSIADRTMLVPPPTAEKLWQAANHIGSAEGHLH